MEGQRNNIRDLIRIELDLLVKIGVYEMFIWMETLEFG